MFAGCRESYSVSRAAAPTKTEALSQAVAPLADLGQMGRGMTGRSSAGKAMRSGWRIIDLPARTGRPSR